MSGHFGYYTVDSSFCTLIQYNTTENKGHPAQGALMDILLTAITVDNHLPGGFPPEKINLVINTKKNLKLFFLWV
jgi:hypothetical protein